MANEEFYLSNIESELKKINRLLSDIVSLLGSMDITLDNIERKN